jgi:hypothetical protein
MGVYVGAPGGDRGFARFKEDAFPTTLDGRQPVLVPPTRVVVEPVSGRQAVRLHAMASRRQARDDDQRGSLADVAVCDRFAARRM